MRANNIRLLEERTGAGLEHWNERVAGSGAGDRAALGAWLEAEGVTGYPKQLLIMERFGYPDFLTAGADDLIEGQYADRAELRAVRDAILVAVADLDGVEIQARKTKISLMTPRRKFAECAPTTKTRVDLWLRIDGEQPSGRLVDAKPREGDVMNLKVGLASAEAVDAPVRAALARASRANT
jgi:uncharacterized protein DUF5655